MPKKKIEHILTPETEKHFFTDQILPPLLRGENITVLWLPHGGTRTQMKFLSKHSNELGYSKLGKHHIVCIDPNLLASNRPEAYFELMTYSLNPVNFRKSENKNLFFNLKEKVLFYLKRNIHLIFVLIDFNRANFPTSFFNNLHSLYQIDKSYVHFIFVTTNKNILEGVSIKKFDQLGELLTQNMVNFPILDKNDSLLVIENLIKKYNYKVDLNKKDLILKLTGGLPGLIRICLRIMSTSPKLNEREITEKLANQWEVNMIMEDVWNSLGNEEKGTILKIAGKSRTDRIPKFLISMGIAALKNEKPKLFSPLFLNFVKNQNINNKTLSISSENGQILINNLPPKEKITLQEHKLLSAFLQRPKEVISREEISEILWGKDSYERYSDWAIDQSISLLRKKLESLGFSSETIQTIKGWGYRWIGH